MWLTIVKEERQVQMKKINVSNAIKVVIGKILINFLGLVIVQIINHQDVVEDVLILDQSIKIFK